MNAFKKLIAGYKALPSEMRLFLAMAGLGTPVGLVYCLAKVLKLPVPLVILGFLGVMIVMGLAGLIIAKLFGRRAKKRSRKMAQDLAQAEDAGPVSMDVRASIKANNEKFFNATREMRKQLGISVYDLPWYIVIGDSGCGKTKLVNEAGLTFSTGKPEGYQLGTLNYNWWFTEDAVFVDMAGRLCNPQDDADRREWLAFLDTIAKGRRGFPINGAIVCVSADHLLQDPAEKHEEDANTALERLRDLQAKLGVTFATYLVVTKCDKILGFMQFYDRAERDISVKNQMFGWSRPGEFNELYDPEGFGEDFNSVYSRLNDLRLRRLNDEADEVELGLAYSFPEEFRTLKDPLHTYVRILFPMIKNPKAVKNLIFRGVYFTSATQQGEVVLKHLTERLGEAAAEHFQPLQDLYPRPRPHFVKDLLFRKVFPEFGLVFRNEQQVVRHRKLSKFLLFGGAATFVLLMGLLWWSTTKFNGLINEPRGHVIAAKKDYMDYGASQALSADLKQDVDNLYQSRNLARILSVFLGSDAPRQHLSTVQAALFEKGVLQRAIEYVQTALRETDLTKLTGSADDADKALVRSYPPALLDYVKWYCRSSLSESSNTLPLPEPEAKDLIGVARKEDPVLREDAAVTAFFDLYRHYYAMAQGGPDVIFGSLAGTVGRRPISLLDTPVVLETRAREGENTEAYSNERDKALKTARDTIRGAIERLRAYYKQYADLAKNADPTIHEWMRLRAQCRTLQDKYDAILSGLDPDKPILTIEALRTYQARFKRDYQAFQAAISELKWKADTDGIKSLHQAIAEQRKRWDRMVSEMEDAAATCQDPDTKAELLKDIRTLRASDDPDRTGLDNILWISLKEAALIGQEARFTVQAFQDLGKYVKEITAVYAHVLSLKKGDRINTRDAVDPTPDTVAIGGKLAAVQADLAKTGGPGAEGQTRTPGEWYEHVSGLLDQVREPPTTTAEAPKVLKLHKAWRPGDLMAFLTKQRVLTQRGAVAEALSSLKDQLTAVKEAQGWGLAEMWQDYQSPGQEGYFRIATQKPARDDSDRKARAKKRERSRTKRERPGRRRARPSGGPKRRTTPVSIFDTATSIPRCAEREFLTQAFEETRDLSDLLAAIDTEDYLALAGGDLRKDCLALLEAARTLYLGRYFGEWLTACNKASRLELDRVLGVDTWDQYRTGMTAREVVDAAGVLKLILAQLLANVAWADGDFRGDPDWLQDQKLIAAARDGIWKQKRFVNQILKYDTPVDSQRPPWEDIAGQVARGWAAFAGQKYPKLPRTDDLDAPKTLSGVNWQVVPNELQMRLSDMWAMEQILQVVQKGKGLLDREITQRILEYQDKVQRGLKQLPYREDKTVATVDPVRFATFLNDMSAVAKRYETLDDALASTSARKRYLKRCAEWRALLFGSENAKEWAKDGLKVTVAMDRNPMKAFPWKAKGAKTPVSGPVNFYLSVKLDLGLTHTDKDGNPQELKLPIIADASERPRECRWPWDHDEAKAAVELVEGTDIITKWPDVSQELGGKNKLSLFAWLQERGQPTDAGRRKWKLGIGWDLRGLYDQISKADPKYAEALRKIDEVAQRGADTYVGTVFVFTLDRRLPEPVISLERPE